MLNSEDVSSVQQIYLSRVHCEDKVVSKVTTDGILKVESEYDVEMASHRPAVTAPTSGWSFLWSEIVAPKVKL